MVALLFSSLVARVLALRLSEQVAVPSLLEDLLRYLSRNQLRASRLCAAAHKLRGRFRTWCS